MHQLVAEWHIKEEKKKNKKTINDNIEKATDIQLLFLMFNKTPPYTNLPKCLDFIFLEKIMV